MTICCPKCASGDGKRIEALYDECRTPERERAAISPELSRQSEPPSPRHPAFWLSLAAVFGFLALATVSSLEADAAAFATCASMSALMGRDAMNYNRSDLPRLLEYWHRSFICTRCGEVFVPG